MGLRVVDGAPPLETQSGAPPLERQLGAPPQAFGLPRSIFEKMKGG